MSSGPIDRPAMFEWPMCSTTSSFSFGTCLPSITTGPSAGNPSSMTAGAPVSPLPHPTRPTRSNVARTINMRRLDQESLPLPSPT